MLPFFGWFTPEVVFLCRWDRIKSGLENQIHLLQLLEVWLSEGQKHHFSGVFKHRLFAVLMQSLAGRALILNWMFCTYRVEMTLALSI